MSGVEKSGGRILDIECLRSVAIAYTLVAHYRFAFGTQPGWIGRLDSVGHFWAGVDLFFVISGFVISKNLIPLFSSFAPDDHRTPFRALLTFWKRRMFRLWPSSWLWALLSLAMIAALYPDHLRGTVSDVMAAFLQLFNVHAYRCVNVPGITTHCSLLAIGVYWSLSLEEQFYILLPVLFFALRARTWVAMLVLLAFGVSMSAWWPVGLGFFRCEGFCLGVLLAFVQSRPGWKDAIDRAVFRRLGPLNWGVTAAMLVALVAIAEGVFGNRPYPLVALASAVLVLLASFDRNYVGVPTFLRRPMVWLGARSYSVYLIHVPVFLVFQRVSGRVPALAADAPAANALWVLGATTVVLGLAELNYRLVETRFRRLGHQSQGPDVPLKSAVESA